MSKTESEEMKRLKEFIVKEHLANKEHDDFSIGVSVGLEKVLSFIETLKR